MEFIDETLPLPPKPPAPAPTGPQMPWTVRECEGLGGRIFRHKQWISNGVTGDLLDKDDEAVLSYVTFLEAENAKLKAALETSEQTKVLLSSGPSATANGPETLGETAVLQANDVPLANTDATTDPRRQRAEEELLKSPGDSNGALAARVGCSDEYIRRVRWELVAAGRLEAPSTSRRGGQHQNPIAGDGPTETPNEVPTATT